SFSRRGHVRPDASRSDRPSGDLEVNVAPPVGGLPVQVDSPGHPGYLSLYRIEIQLAMRLPKIRERCAYTS
ncbi:MAG: hypothetical protein QOD87_1075, partial [Pseudonocardiales bacterium]|nr:hypothetical protein [Pseudonocardiales bacterium]